MAKSNEDAPAGAKTDSCTDTVEARGMRVDMAVTLLCAARYAMGRRSYVPGCVISVLRKNFHVLNECQRALLAKEIRDEYAETGAFGYSAGAYERADWLELADILDGGGARG